MPTREVVAPITAAARCYLDNVSSRPTVGTVRPGISVATPRSRSSNMWAFSMDFLIRSSYVRVEIVLVVDPLRVPQCPYSARLLPARHDSAHRTSDPDQAD